MLPLAVLLQEVLPTQPTTPRRQLWADMECNHHSRNMECPRSPPMVTRTWEAQLLRADINNLRMEELQRDMSHRHRVTQLRDSQACHNKEFRA